MRSMTFGKKLNKKTRKLIISYSIEDITKDYEIIKQIVYKCKKEGLRYYFSIDNNKNLRYFIILSDNSKILELFSEKV